MLVSPEPQLGTRADRQLERVPAKLCNFGGGRIRWHIDGGKITGEVGAVGLRHALAGDEFCAGPVAQGVEDRAHRCPQPEAADRHRAMLRIEAEIGQGTKFAAALEHLEHADEHPLLRDDLVPARRSQSAEDRPKKRVFEILENDRPSRYRIRGGMAEPLEISEVRAEINAGIRGIAVTRIVVEALDAEHFLPAAAGKIRRPEKAEHRAGEILVGRLRDPLALVRRVFAAEGGLQILQRVRAPARIRMKGQRAEFVRDLLDGVVGQLRNEPRDSLERPILDAIAQALEAGDIGEWIG